VSVTFEISGDEGFGVAPGGQALRACDEIARLPGEEMQLLVVLWVEVVVRGEGNVVQRVTREIGQAQYLGPTTDGDDGVGMKAGRKLDIRRHSIELCFA